ncbi:dehydrogenase/flavin-dependent oxidoreductase protein [Bradyrhizobium lupini HPC(L)]|uniref:Dehydrogenase/flavin-dependent oxidoreductase protein n=1 Tax=Bradyrhizobium lupini HPC(L) TaxID=1229491 RepID=A0ABN0HK95_RHILU|nr:dehydrogenase/flavin-dependent oxidoreductase protein [Bradyrhizobium lupini HPC(L)]
MIIGYHASHEQFAPHELLSFIKLAEQAGFNAVMTSDHINPWSGRQGNSGNNWAWLGAAMAITTLPFGSLAIPGGLRYHPVTLAHLIATLSEMFPDRLRWVAVGSGEALNEHVVGKGWPDKHERNLRLQAGADIMRRLLRGETVSRVLPWFSADDARLWSLPVRPPALFGAALSAQTAAWMGEWTDGLLTVRKPQEELVHVFDQYRSRGGSDKPLALQLQLSWGATRDEARIAAWDQWRTAAAPADRLSNLASPAAFDSAMREILPEEMDRFVPLVTEAGDVLRLIDECRSCGVGEVYIHNVSRDQAGFIRFMGREVLPAVAATSPT